MEEGTVFAVIIFPRPWPVPETQTLFKNQKADWAIELKTDSAGQLIVVLSKNSKTLREVEFQKVEISGSGKAIITITWSPTEVSLRVNSSTLEIASETGDKAFLLNDSNVLAVESPLFYNLDLQRAKNEHEYLFLGCVVDIEQKLQGGSRYSIIKAAGLLRQLFLDATPLIYEVNRAYKLKINFETIDFTSKPPLNPEIHWVNLDASRFPGAKTVKVDLQQFLKSPCLRLQVQEATVKDIIKACANVKGGVHLGKVWTQEEQVVLDLDMAIKILGQEPSLRAIAGISRIALKGLGPLVNAIIS